MTGSAARFLAGLVLAMVALAGCGLSREPAGPDMAVILAERPAPRLSDYGLFTDTAARLPAAGVVTYDLVNPLFSDHASKHRLVFMPPGEAANYHPRDVFAFPVGTVLVKSFAYAPDMRTPAAGERYVETRLLVHKTGGWVAYPYIWNEAGTEAVYAPIGGRQTVETTDPAGTPLTIQYAVPNQNQCKTCHQVDGALTPIGPRARNLNHEGPDGANQIAAWQAQGRLTGVPGSVPMAVSYTDTDAATEARARAYLDINCAHCHRAGGAASNSGLWLTDDETSPVKVGIGKHPTAAGRGAGDSLVVIAPGDPDRSILAYRMASAEAGVAMPELGRTLVHEEGVALVRAWIETMPEAPAP